MAHHGRRAGWLGRLVDAVRPARPVPEAAIPPADEVVELQALVQLLRREPEQAGHRFLGRTVHTWGRVQAVDRGRVRVQPEAMVDGWPDVAVAQPILAGAVAGLSPTRVVAENHT